MAAWRRVRGEAGPGRRSAHGRRLKRGEGVVEPGAGDETATQRAWDCRRSSLCRIAPRRGGRRAQGTHSGNATDRGDGAGQCNMGRASAKEDPRWGHGKGDKTGAGRARQLFE